MAVRMSELLLGALGELRYQPTAKRVRARLDGAPVLDSTRAVLVWEPTRVVPAYAVPVEDVQAELLPAPPREVPPARPVRIAGGRLVHDPSTPFAFHTAPGVEHDVRVGDAVRERAAFALDGDLAGTVVLDFDAFDWWEEDEPIVGHPRDPFDRIDVRRSGRHVRFEHRGELVAESTRALVLFEGAFLPVRHYLPREDVAVELVPSPTRSTCAYKGHAVYWSATVAGEELRDVAWSYPEPLSDAEQLRDRVALFAERLDVVVDGVRQETPLTPWS